MRVSHLFISALLCVAVAGGVSLTSCNKEEKKPETFTAHGRWLVTRLEYKVEGEGYSIDLRRKEKGTASLKPTLEWLKTSLSLTAAKQQELAGSMEKILDITAESFAHGLVYHLMADGEVVVPRVFGKIDRLGGTWSETDAEVLVKTNTPELASEISQGLTKSLLSLLLGCEMVLEKSDGRLFYTIRFEQILAPIIAEYGKPAAGETAAQKAERELMLKRLKDFGQKYGATLAVITLERA